MQNDECKMQNYQKPPSGGFFSVSKNFRHAGGTVQKGVRLVEWNPKMYVYTSRGGIWAKQAETPLKLDVSRGFVILWFKRRKHILCSDLRASFHPASTLYILRLWSRTFFDSLNGGDVFDITSICVILLLVL